MKAIENLRRAITRCVIGGTSLLAVATALASLSGDAQAHNTTSVCWDTWDSDFATTNNYDNYRLSFMGWSKLDSNGQVVHCPAPDGPGHDDATNTDYMWDDIGYDSPCWFWRHRCGNHYIRLEDDVGEGHTWFEEWGDPATSDLEFCDPGDGKGTGFVSSTSGYVTPNCQNWSTGNLSTVESHAAYTSLILWVEHFQDHQPVIYDFDYVQVRGGISSIPTVPNGAMEIAIKVGPNEDDWYISDPLAPNSQIPGQPGQYYYYDIRSWGFQVERAVIRNADPNSAKIQLGGVYYSMASQSGWGTADVCGNGACSATESCSTCAQDCGACIVCGDGTCSSGAETCTSCAQDCGACPTPCTGICNNPTNFTWAVNGNYQSGNLGTGAVCRQTTKPLVGGNCGNFAAGRTLKVNGTTMTCNNQNWSNASIPAARNGGYCVSANSGNHNFAYYTMW